MIQWWCSGVHSYGQKGNSGFLQCEKYYIQYTKVGFAVTMGSDGVSEVGAGAGEILGRMKNGTSLASGSIAGPGACWGGRSVGAETSVHNELVEVGGFFESDRGGVGKEVLG